MYASVPLLLDDPLDLRMMSIERSCMGPRIYHDSTVVFIKIYSYNPRPLTEIYKLSRHCTATSSPRAIAFEGSSLLSANLEPYPGISLKISTVPRALRTLLFAILSVPLVLTITLVFIFGAGPFNVVHE